MLLTFFLKSYLALRIHTRKNYSALKELTGSDFIQPLNTGIIIAFLHILGITFRVRTVLESLKSKNVFPGLWKSSKIDKLWKVFEKSKFTTFKPKTIIIYHSIIGKRSLILSLKSLKRLAKVFDFFGLKWVRTLTFFQWFVE